MIYLSELKSQITQRNYTKFLQIWDEYCKSDQIEAEELIQILQMIKTSDFSKPFGKIVSDALPIYQSIQEQEASYSVLKLLIDLQSTNSSELAEITLNTLQKRHGHDPLFQERLRIIGMRTKENFQGALANYDLLVHMEKGNFVLHSAGWGAGEIMTLSPLRQQVTIEFENIRGLKHITFENAFKTLIPLNKDHFLVRRFAFADDLEKEAKADSTAIIQLLLRDLGPKTASEIKDILCDSVIPEKEWTKWWQTARTKLKKYPLIETPENLKAPFTLRKTEISQEERLSKAMKKKTSINDVILATYNFLRDTPSVAKNQEVRLAARQKLVDLLSNPELTAEQELQIVICLEIQFNEILFNKDPKSLIKNCTNINELLDNIEILVLKKRALILIKEVRSDWIDIFLNQFLYGKQALFREYIAKELNHKDTQKILSEEIKTLLQNPEKAPECFIWLFNKLIVEKNEENILPIQDKNEKMSFAESCLILLNRLESKTEHKELVKKIYVMLSAKRYQLVRTLFENASLEFVKEFLLLAAKCHTFTNHDIKIFRSLAAVVYPTLSKTDHSEEDSREDQIFWTTEIAFLKIQDKLKHMSTVEVVENAREVEAARALGDLRENSEYKFAVERRSRLQREIKLLGEQLQNSRIITKEDINIEEISIGTVVELLTEKNNHITYTILGSWDADTDLNILSDQSKLAQAMIGYKEGESFQFREEKFKVVKIKSYL